MNATAVAVPDIPALDHDEAMALAAEEYHRLIELAASLSADDWLRQTPCPDWDVRALLSHLLAMMERFCDPEEAARQDAAAGERMATQDIHRIDALTAVQVEQRAHLTPAEVLAALRSTAPRALQGRDRPPEVRAVPYQPGPPYTGTWPLGYLFDVILTRDSFIHRVDIAGAIGRELVVTHEHEGRLIADVVADWARRHGAPFTLVLGGPAGGTYIAGGGGEEHESDAIEFCRVLSGRGRGHGLLATPVPF